MLLLSLTSLSRKYTLLIPLQEPSQLDDDEAGDTIWTPLPRRIASNVIDDYLGAEEGQQQQHNNNKRGGHYPPHITTPPPQLPQQRDPASYYQNEYENAAYRNVAKLLDEVSSQNNIQSLWDDGGMLICSCVYTPHNNITKLAFNSHNKSP